MKIPVLVIGGGLSGIAAAIRIARFAPDVQILEQHSRLGGLNSYFYRNQTLFETGLHAITNYAEAGDKKAPLNRLLRQLKLRRREISFCQQLESRVEFYGHETLRFSNQFELLDSEVHSKFPQAYGPFRQLIAFIDEFDPFAPAPFRSAKTYLSELLGNRLLVDMLLCPLMFYGSSYENDMDLSQFAIMFRAIYIEGMFRPKGSIKDFLDLLTSHYKLMGGSIRTKCQVKKILHCKGQVTGVELNSGETIECDHLLSTIGSDETMALLEDAPAKSMKGDTRLGFIETIYELKRDEADSLPTDTTIIFYNKGENFNYSSPDDYIDNKSGVICFPGNFSGLPAKEKKEIRFTHLANYSKWKKLASDPEAYLAKKFATSKESRHLLEPFIGRFNHNIVFENTFTPVTIERYTSKRKGAIYGNPVKIKDGNIGYKNLFIAGTDQGFLGIIGSMLSGVSIVNQHILPKL
ncbi:MAG: phytoene dehydrogenase [Desulfotalea sp.]|nr:MAG: phytoene dehydrogenase [Desulfotalea sp.]